MQSFLVCVHFSGEKGHWVFKGVFDKSQLRISALKWGWTWKVTSAKCYQETVKL